MRQKAANDALLAQLTMLEHRLKNLEDSNATRLDGVRGALVQGLNVIRADNNKKLEEIRGHRGGKTAGYAAKADQRFLPHRQCPAGAGLQGPGRDAEPGGRCGQPEAGAVGGQDPGHPGEVQLGAILEQILAPGQYGTNVATVPGSNNRVEFAVKLQGQSGTVWLPIDAKFPGDTYAHLQAAQQRGDAAATAAMRKALFSVLRQEAKDIHDKYIEVPYTTSFGILFLPFEGLYAEVVSSGVTETLQRDYQITVAGPSTMAALLNALQMGFRTLAIQKRSGEVVDGAGGGSRRNLKVRRRFAADAAAPQPDRLRSGGTHRSAQPGHHPQAGGCAAAGPRYGGRAAGPAAGFQTLNGVLPFYPSGKESEGIS